MITDLRHLTAKALSLVEQSFCLQSLFILLFFSPRFFEAVAVVVILFVPEIVISASCYFFHVSFLRMSEFSPQIVDTTPKDDAFLLGQYPSDADILWIYPFIYPVVIVFFYYQCHREAPYLHCPPRMSGRGTEVAHIQTAFILPTAVLQAEQCVYLSIYHIVKHACFKMGNAICRCAVAHTIYTSFSHNIKVEKIISIFHALSKSYPHAGFGNFDGLNVVCCDGSHL